jgi:HK97 gp10 family phage protein
VTHATQLLGYRETLAALANVDKKVRRKLLRKWVNAGSSKVLKAAKKLAPVGAGSLAGLYRKSLGRKVKTYQSGAVAVALIGARSGFRMPIGANLKANKDKPTVAYEESAVGATKGAIAYQDPVKIAHFLEKGTAHAKAVPHLRPALEDNTAALASSFKEIVGKGIEAGGA